MSWASHEWKDGLPVKALSNIEELEKQRDRLRKELQQRQLQIESMEQVNTKQKQKFDVERMAYTAMATDNKILMETCEQLEKKRHRLEYDLQMKEAQLLQIEEGYTQKKKQLDEQSHKSMMLERQLEKLEGMVSVMEVHEKNSVNKINMVRDMLQDQHWHDVAQIAAERDATGDLKVKLLRTQNEFLKQKFAHKGDRACSQANQSSGDSDELMQLQEKVTRLTQELKTQHHQGQRVAEERDALKEKFTDMLLINRQQVTELSEQLHVLQAEHKGLVEQCSSQMSTYTEELDTGILPVPPEKPKKKPRTRPVFCPTFSSRSTGGRSRSWSSQPSLADLKKSKTEQQVSLTVVEKLRRELDEVKKGNIRLMREKAYLLKENTKLESDHIHMESQFVQLIQPSVPSTHTQSQTDAHAAVDLKTKKAKYSSLVTENPSLQEQRTEDYTALQKKYKLAVDRNKEMQRQLEDAQRNGSGKKMQPSVSKMRKQEDQLRSLKAEVTTLKAKLADSELLISKYQRDIAEKRKIHMAESQSLNNKLKKMTVARDQLVKNLDEMTDRWKYLEQQLNSKVEMLAVFGKKLEVAESVANDLESKFEVKMKKAETEQGRVENLKANLVSTRAALDNVLTKYNALKQDYDSVCQTRDPGAMKPDHPRPHGMPWCEGQWSGQF